MCTTEHVYCVQHEQVALGAVGNHDNSYQHTTAPQSSNSYAHPYDGADSRYNTASRYTPTHTMSSPAQYQVPASGPSYSSPVNAYPPADFAVAYQPASPSRDTLQVRYWHNFDDLSYLSSIVIRCWWHHCVCAGANLLTCEQTVTVIFPGERRPAWCISGWLVGVSLVSVPTMCPSPVEQWSVEHAAY